MAANNPIRPFKPFIFVRGNDEYLRCWDLPRGKAHKASPILGSMEDYDEFKCLLSEEI
jgi:hypothetical protein